MASKYGPYAAGTFGTPNQPFIAVQDSLGRDVMFDYNGNLRPLGYPTMAAAQADAAALSADDSAYLAKIAALEGPVTVIDQTSKVAQAILAIEAFSLTGADVAARAVILAILSA